MNKKKFSILFVILTLLNCCWAKGTKEIFINYAAENEGIYLYKYFHNVNDGYYVDIGAYDAIILSNTLNLMSLGWTGINIDASSIRLPVFEILRKGQPNLNYAIANDN